MAGVNAGYGAVRALAQVSLAVRNGKTVVLIGPNGNGKSTLMKCLMGLVRPSAGTITLEVDGTLHDLTRLATEDIVGLGVALVPKGRQLFPKLTVEENLRRGAYRKEARTSIGRNLASLLLDSGVLAFHVVQESQLIFKAIEE
jgi:branched-chain amino acid transport system ATP-binding protein